MSQPQLFATGVLLAWLAGIRVYLTVFGVGLAGALGWLELPQALRRYMGLNPYRGFESLSLRQISFAS